MSNEQIAAAIQQTAPYRSEWTGKEVDIAIGRILALDEYINATMLVPPFKYTGGTTTFPLLQFVRQSTLKSMVMKCIRPFTDASQITNYSLKQRNVSTIITIPSEFFQMGDSTLELLINAQIPAGAILDIVADNAISVGEMEIKLILG